MKEETTEKKLYIPPDFFVLDFKETKGGMAYDPVEDDWAEPQVGPS